MAQVHDSLLFQVPISLGAYNISKGITQIREFLTPTILLNGREFILHTDMKTSLTSWNNMKEIDISTDVYSIESNLKDYLEIELETTKRLDNSIP